MNLSVIVLAAGAGTRMRSATSKVLHHLAGRPLVFFPVSAALDAGATRCVVVASPRDAEALELWHCKTWPGDERFQVVVQREPRGTGDAARAGLAGLGGVAPDASVLIVYGDAALLRSQDLGSLVSAFDPASTPLALMSCILPEPTGYGRVLRDPRTREVERICEERDLGSAAQRAINEVNAGVYLARSDFLREALASLVANNAQREEYLTDIVGFAAQRGGVQVVLGDADALRGVNDRSQLEHAEGVLFQRIAERHRLAGVTIQGDACIDDTVVMGEDSRIASGVALRRATRLGARVQVDVGAVITDATLEDEVVVRPYSIITGSHLRRGAQVGPFAHVRPGSEVGEEARVGNFVELKNTRLHRGAKANHLAYLGDGDVGEGANIGAGTVFCNYDGAAKHKTEIGPGAFIGSDTQLIAPIRVGAGAYVATGTTATQDIPDNALALSRAPLIIKDAYAPKLRARLEARAGALKK